MNHVIRLALFGALALALAAVFCGCVESDSRPPWPTIASQPPAPPTTVLWLVPDPLLITLGTPIDLARTLPPAVARGGIFGVAEGQLPPGVTLSTSGVLVATVPGAAPGRIVLSYTEPGP